MPPDPGHRRQGGEQKAFAGQSGQLHGRYRTSAPDLVPGAERVDDIAHRRNVLDLGELDPLHVVDNSYAHRSGYCHARITLIGQSISIVDIVIGWRDSGSPGGGEVFEHAASA